MWGLGFRGWRLVFRIEGNLFKRPHEGGLVILAVNHVSCTGGGGTCIFCLTFSVGTRIQHATTFRVQASGFRVQGSGFKV